MPDLEAGSQFMAAFTAGAVAALIQYSVSGFEAVPLNTGDGSFTLKWTGSPVSMEIYPDQVNFVGPDLDVRLERYDYDDLRGLANAALLMLRRHLANV